MKFIFCIFYKMLLIVGFLILSLNACSSSFNEEPSFNNTRSIPRLNDITVDGNPSEWPESYEPVRLLSDIEGNAPDPDDFKAWFRLAWNENGLLFMAEVEDDAIYEDQKKFWNGDGVELFLSPAKGSFDIVQVSIRPSLEQEDSLVFINIYDHRRSDSLKSISPEPLFFCSKSSSGYRLEGLIPLNMLGISKPCETMEMALQLYINDSDFQGDTSNFSLPWFPVRDSYRNPHAFQTIRFTQSGKPAIPLEFRAIVRNDQNLYIKVLSLEHFRNRELGIRAGNQSRHFGLKQEKPGLFIHEWNLPVRKVGSEKDRLGIFLHDSLLFEIDLVVLHRIYEDFPEPNRFEKEIRIFEILDHFSPLPPQSYIITGSSTVRRWNNINTDLPGYNFINRGFGGSTMDDLNHYAERIVFPYSPSGIFIYEGDNDIARGGSPSHFINECSEFINECRTRIPETEIYFLSIKPSPARMKNWKEMQAANRLLEDLCMKYDKVYYIDISKGLMDETGEPDEDLFVRDQLHLNEKGYRILSKSIESFLIKE